MEGLQTEKGTYWGGLCYGVALMNEGWGETEGRISETEGLTSKNLVRPM